MKGHDNGTFSYPHNTEKHKKYAKNMIVQNKVEF